MARRENVFVKVSGDEFRNPAFRSWVKELSDSAYVAICCGGGTQINAEYERRGIPCGSHGPMGREIPTFEGRQMVRDILELNQRDLEDWLAEDGVHVPIVIPVFYIGDVLCHVNGDEMVRVAYLGYDRLYVVTTPDRLERKKIDFLELSSKVEIIAFDRP